MRAVIRGIDAVCLAGALTAAALLLVLFTLGLTEIILRSVFTYSLPIAVEYIGYLLVLVMFLGSGWTLSKGGHIRVTLLSERLSPAHGRTLDLACTAIGIVIAGFLSVSLIQFAWGTFVRGIVSYFPSETPLAYPQALLAIGPCILTLALIGRGLRLITGEPVDVADSDPQHEDQL